jgi:PAS domain S-box-containing protein
MSNTLITSTIDMIYKLDGAGSFIYLNTIMLDFLEVGLKEVLGVHYSSFVRKDYVERTHSYYLTQLKQGESTSYFEVPIINRKGKEYWLGQTVEVLQNESGITEFLVVARDITDRIKATQSMLQSEQKYRSVIQNINLGLMEVDLEETIVYVNEAFCTMMGYEAEELLGTTASKVFIDPNDALQQAQMNTANAMRLKGDSSAYELRIKRKDGTYRWMIISGAPIRNPAGEVVGSLGIHNDITQRKEEELYRLELIERVEHSNQLLQEKERKLRSVINSALDAVITINEAGFVLEWNKQAEEIFGFAEVEAVGKKLSTLIIPKEFARAHEEGMRHFLHTGEGPVLHKRIEITGRHKSGQHFNVELSISPIKLEHEYIFSAFVRDITLKKKAEQDMEEALHKQRELNELRSRLVSITSHEFRTPLTTIKSNIDLLQHKVEAGIDDPQKLSRNFERIAHEIDRLNHIMSDILLIGRLESGKMPFKPKPTNYVHLLQEVIDHNFKEQAHRLLMHTVGTPWEPLLDADMYTHVLLNLLGNALKYSDDEVLLTLHFKQDALTLSIADKGIGIPERDQEKLFDSFYRASNAEDKSGTGLGLNLVKQFCEVHDVAVTFESVLGQGTTFYLNHQRT